MALALSTAQPPQLDDLFSALADPTRRAIIDRLLARGELSVGEVAAPFDISTPAITRHLQVLERAGLIARRVEPAQLLKWWAPDGCEASVDVLEVRPGGGWRTTLHKPDGSRASTSGLYCIVEPPRRLSFTWAWEGDNGARGHESEVTVT